MLLKQLRMLFMIIPVLLVPHGSVWATLEEDIEKPRPEFSQQDGDWIARLIPRGKSTPIQIRFHAEDGNLTAVSDKQYTPENHPKVDPKNFRSDFFSIQARTAPGAEIAVSVSSAYFTSATELWCQLEPNAIAWGPSGATNMALGDRINMLTVKVCDGGTLDADGEANGRIELIVGPRDSFWGYALGTLFIRFFGIFLVLSILMVGIMFSGKVFKWIEGRAERAKFPEKEIEPQFPEVPFAPLPATVAGVDPETVATIALAIHLSSAIAHPQAPAGPAYRMAASDWALFGRGKLMTDRKLVFDRIQKK